MCARDWRCGELPGGFGGAGSMPDAPTVTNANILIWYNGGFAIIYQVEGEGAGSNVGWQSGGDSSYGVYIQAYTLDAHNRRERSNWSFMRHRCSGGGGGGGGVIMLAYGRGVYTPGTFHMTEGAEEYVVGATVMVAEAAVAGQLNMLGLRLH